MDHQDPDQNDEDQNNRRYMPSIQTGGDFDQKHEWQSDLGLAQSSLSGAFSPDHHAALFASSTVDAHGFTWSNYSGSRM
jgi:hypothetical protein